MSPIYRILKILIKLATFALLTYLLLLAAYHEPHFLLSDEPYKAFEYNMMSPKKNSTHSMSQLIDIKNFTFTILNRVCNKNNTFMLILIHSAPTNVAKRTTIRTTWGNNTTILFMLGLVSNKTLQRLLDEENAKYHDFIQGSFMDSYKNMSYKHAMSLKYAANYCNQTKYIVKSDDDAFINAVQLKYYLKRRKIFNNLLFCQLNNRNVLRMRRFKWALKVNEYPFRYYPKYCQGYFIVYSIDVVIKLDAELQNVSYFWVDDVLITGFLAKKLGLRHEVNQLQISRDNENWIISHMGVWDDTYVVKPFINGNSQLTQLEIELLWMYAGKYKYI